MDQHYILCGLGRVGARVLDHLRSAGVPVVVIDTRCSAGDARLSGAELVVGDCRRKEVLEEAGLARARGILVLPSDELISLQTALMVRHLNPAVRVVVRLFNHNLIKRLGAAVDNIHTLSVSSLAAPLLALVARTGEALGTFCLEDGSTSEIAEFTLAPQSSLVMRRLGEEARKHQAAVIAHIPPRESLALSMKWTSRPDWPWATAWWCADLPSTWHRSCRMAGANRCRSCSGPTSSSGSPGSSGGPWP